jgi:hypothetical protein
MGRTQNLDSGKANVDHGKVCRKVTTFLTQKILSFAGVILSNGRNQL